MKTIEVVAAIIVHRGQVLCAQRGESKLDYISRKYEFPGGKVENNESLEKALIREIKEELEMDINIRSHFTTVEHAYPDFNIIMHSFLCDVNSRTLQLSEHLNIQWLNKHELDNLDWAEADLPIVEKFKVSDYE